MSTEAPSNNAPSSGNATAAWAIVHQIVWETGILVKNVKDYRSAADAMLLRVTDPVERVVRRGVCHLARLAEEGQLATDVFLDRRIFAYIARSQRDTLECDGQLKTLLQICADDKETKATPASLQILSAVYHDARASDIDSLNSLEMHYLRLHAASRMPSSSRRMRLRSYPLTLRAHAAHP